MIPIKYRGPIVVGHAKTESRSLWMEIATNEVLLRFCMSHKLICWVFALLLFT